MTALSYTTPLREKLNELLLEFKSLSREADVDTIIEALDALEELEEELEIERMREPIYF